MNAGAAAGSASTAVVLLAIAAVLWWKGASLRLISWLALLAGLTGSAVIVGWLGSLADVSVYGVSVLGLFIIVGAVILWHELIKRRDMHKIRTPIVALLWGAAVMTAGGGIVGTLAHQASSVTTNITDQGTSTVVGQHPGR